MHARSYHKSQERHWPRAQGVWSASACTSSSLICASAAAMGCQHSGQICALAAIWCSRLRRYVHGHAGERLKAASTSGSSVLWRDELQKHSIKVHALDLHGRRSLHKNIHAWRLPGPGHALGNGPEFELPVTLSPAWDHLRAAWNSCPGGASMQSAVRVCEQDGTPCIDPQAAACMRPRGAPAAEAVTA